MRKVLASIAVMLALLGVPRTALANVQVEVDVGSQTMEVYVRGQLRHTWKVSTGRRGYETPGGSYRAKRIEAEWYSTLYDDAPMPHAVFFKGGYAIHGTYDVKRLGRPASHGCVRLAPGNAARLYNLVARHGLKSTSISINH
ncbi:MAG: L,D-transpeptidase [Hyphomicrobium sp.]|nr:L,D-transpeptidase [Hyphomicrobium sp.]